MRRTIPLLLTGLLLLVVGCSSDDSAEPDRSTTTTTERFSIFDPSAPTTEEPDDEEEPDEPESTTTTAFVMPEGGEPEEFCSALADLEAEFADLSTIDASVVTALRSLQPWVPEELEEDLERMAETFESIVGFSFEEIAADPVLAADVYTPEVLESQTRLDAWIDASCTE